ncbi:MAG: 2-oxoacid:acceptor oxidoreductase subunit alpha [Candidatus Goldbacteria bacterium]|nr:2-oxoacid:acceptor oxidoreductase subunit alpha [Candidatus Goldiibacteriota bacterium]
MKIKSADNRVKREVSIVLSGEAGQGIQSIETILIKLIKQSGYNVFATKEYMSRVRGGVNATMLRVSQDRAAAPVDKTDIFIPLEKEALARYAYRLDKNTIIAGDAALLQDSRVNDIAFGKIAEALGNPLFSSMVAAGAACGIIGIGKETADDFIQKLFGKKGEETVNGNIKAFAAGYEAGARTAVKNNFKIKIDKNIKIQDEFMLSGADAVAIGAIAGGCSAAFAYPMTPGTSVFTALAEYSHKGQIAVEQAEDEIAAINMALGAWYAGARAMVSTSGGGFDLMTEGVSLAGITETPVVIHLAQRPGPATGYPTRTEQGDLNLALHAGHGDFARVILAPGNTLQAFELARKAFDTADKYQVPVFIMTDQYFVDTYYNIPRFEVKEHKNQNYIVETKEGYKRYALTKDGISPRGVPGFGTGCVCLDSDEHDEDGRITEDLSGIGLKMKEKRMKKSALLNAAAIKPSLYGNKNYKTIFICWGSVLNTALEAIKISGLKDAAILHYSQVYPLHKSTADIIKKAKKAVMIENNQTGQFAGLIKKETGLDIGHKILRYDGLAFSADGLAELMKKSAAIKGKKIRKPAEKKKGRR